MKHLRTFAILMTSVPLPACTDYATFVTSTDIGISADANTQNVNIGYTRAELFTGPGYPEQGEAPRAVGFIASDLHVFQPHIKQLYATGDAAELVTLPEKPPSQPPPAAGQPLPPPAYYGQRRPLVFGTGTNVGLKVGFGAGTAPVPSSFKFGYNREELSIIPLRREQPTDKTLDRYAPVLASIDMDLAASTQPDTNVRITQFFATGSAARNLALHPDIQDIFETQAKAAVQQAAVREGIVEMNKKAQSNAEAINAYFAKYSTAQFSTARNALLDNSGLPSNNPRVSEMRALNNKADFMSYLTKNSSVAALLARRIPASSS